MIDPTELILTSGFALVLVVFVISLVAKGSLRKRPDPVIEARLGEIAVGRPDGTPHEPGVGPLPPTPPSGKVPVWIYRPLDLLGAAFVFVVFAWMVTASFGRDSGSMEINPSILVVNIGFHFFMAGIVTVIVCQRVEAATWLGLGWSRWPWVLLIAPGTVLFMWTIFGGLQISGYVKWMESLGVETVQDTVKLLQKSTDPLELGLMAFAAVVAASICEEVVFRGYLYPVLKKFNGIGPAVFCSAMLFAAAHGSLTALLPLFIFGVVLVFVYEKTGSIWAPIAVHFCFNGATVLAQMAVRYHQVPLEVAR